MINLLKYHKQILYYIVMVGCGGNGGYAVQRITKMMHAFTHVPSYLMLADPDQIEEKNLLRQPFVKQDLAKKKSEVLANRYGATYGLRIGSYSDSYIESVEQLENLFNQTDYMHKQGQHIQKVLIGAVDNGFSRKIMDDYFQKSDDIIYIDAGIEGVYVPSGDRSPEEWTADEQQEHIESGYSGQVVIGLKKNGKVLLPPLNEVYPIDVKDAIPPSHNCGLEPYQPQRMIANENAALQISTIVNELFSSNSILVNVVNFNARTMLSRPTYVDETK
ncbi:ThiF family adenylyltransferase [Paenibacillus sp. MMO-58]|uniref:ThiF family adenylyltransferase n=1 Tax=Paenibacillus sp. MMO-58 TaxID=3081290 RepID=UPI003019BE3E